MAKKRTKQVSGKVAGLLFFVLLMLCVLNLLPPVITAHLTNLHKILLYLVIFIVPMLIYIKTFIKQTEIQIKRAIFLFEI